MKSINLFRSELVTLIDDEDYERLIIFRWVDNGFGYAVRHEGDLRYWMHKEVMQTNQLVDHIDRNKLNNQKSNLQLSNKSANMQNCKVLISNTSGYRGVCWHKATKRWCAQLIVNKKKVLYRMFKSPEDAAKAYDKAALEHFGSNAALNFPNQLIQVVD